MAKTIMLPVQIVSEYIPVTYLAIIYARTTCK